MSGRFGRVEFGSDDPASTLMYYGPQGTIAGQGGVTDASIVNATLGDAGIILEMQCSLVARCFLP